MFSVEIIVIVALALSAVALSGVLLLTRRRKHAQKEPPASSMPQSDRWLVLEIERKDSAENGSLWEVHDDWKLRDNREVAQ